MRLKPKGQSFRFKFFHTIQAKCTHQKLPQFGVAEEVQLRENLRGIQQTLNNTQQNIAHCHRTVPIKTFDKI